MSIKWYLGLDLLLVVILLEMMCNVLCQEFIGCGGFVKSDIGISYSRIQMKVYNKEGALKYHTDCAPNNGYFMIPIYDKGEFVLKIEPPQGWSFEPTSVELNIDGKSDVCSKGEDINFQFMGFAVEGKVISKGQSIGPQGVVISMETRTEIRKPMKTATNSSGKFKFPKIMPGDYVVTATHPVWRFKKVSTSLTVTKDSVALTDSLVVAGYDVKGQVSSEGEMVPNVKFVLLSDTVKSEDVSDCQKKAPNGFQHSGSKAVLCYVQSDAMGQFVFPSVPTGQYSVTQFQIEGFSVVGKVLDSVKGKGIAGVTVTVNNKSPTITKADGSFRLEKMKSGHYKINAAKDHYHFGDLMTKITANTPELNDIVANRFDLCGRLRIDQWPSGLVKRVHSIVVTGKGTVTKTVGKDGRFCVDVSPGNYVVKVEISDKEHSAGLRLTQETRNIEISTGPVLDVDFQQFKATLKGFVNCLDKCGSINIAMASVDHPSISVRTIKISQNTKRASFIIRDILPGTYTLSGDHAAWCWKEPITFKVSNSDLNDINIVQSGYKLQCQSSHACSMQYRHISVAKSSGEFAVVKGSNTFCVDTPGQYKLTTTSCHQFDKKEYQFDTSNPAKFSMMAMKHQVQGSIVSKEMASDIVVKITSSVPSEGPVTLGPLKGKASPTAELKEPANKDGKAGGQKPGAKKPAEKDNKYTYEFTHWASIAMTSVDHPSIPVRTIKISQNTKRASFIIRDILPGTYTLSGDHVAWCWKEPVTFKVSNSDLNDINIVQSGYKLQCQSSHACSMEMASDIVVKITSSVPSEAPVTLGPLKGKVSQTAELKEPANKDGKAGGQKPGAKKPAEKDNKYTYEFTHWARRGENLKFEPVSGEVLFYPKVLEVKVKGDTCPGEVVAFEARAGIFISGQITPPIQAVVIEIHTKTPGSSGTVDVIRTETDDQGKYRVGPFVDTNEYTVDAEKKGYTLTPQPDNPTNFRAYKLGEIIIQVVDEDDQPLSDVVLSLSGGSFRSNQITLQTGKVPFYFLGAGQYYLRAFRKEYEFEPDSKMIEVQEASSVNLTIRGHRVAFSCYGTVTSLNGEPEPNVALEARGLAIGNCEELMETALSDSNGEFRVRGLKPSCVYELKLKMKDGRDEDNPVEIERAVPPVTILKPEEKDIKDVKIIVFRKQTTFDVGGNVITDSQFVNTLKVVVFKEDDLDSPIHTLALGASSFFQLPSLPMDGQEYVMKLESSLSKSNYNYNTQEASFIAEGVYQHITFEFNPERRNIDQDFSQGSYFALPFIVALIAIGFNHSKVLPFLKQIGESFQKRKPVPVRYDSREQMDEARQKKKTKLRKT
ncbi:nodal modulator 1-like [Anneissia japonica]|uniref:nodal modulator 1-like n=1 Tax=Anneissia japonica TaxID=1529436 RepID=UPI00142552E7|nr:nodal modulator 1-like [Anneissia japonica]